MDLGAVTIFLALVNSATVKMHVLFLMFSVPSSMYPGVEFLGYMVILFNFLRDCQTVFHNC